MQLRYTAARDFMCITSYPGIPHTLSPNATHFRVSHIVWERAGKLWYADPSSFTPSSYLLYQYL